MFLSGGIGDVLRFNTVNHACSLTLMAKVCVVAFGVRELSFRLPTLAGAALYFASVYFLCRRLFPGTLLRFLAFALLCLNPAVLDFMSAARGYGLGLAFLMAATLAIVMAFDHGVGDRGARDLDPRAQQFEWRWECRAASIFLALAVTANVTNIVAAAALALMFAWIITEAEGRRSGQIPVALLGRYFILPGAALFLFLMWPYLIQIRAGHIRHRLPRRVLDAARHLQYFVPLQVDRRHLLARAGGRAASGGQLAAGDFRRRRAHLLSVAAGSGCRGLGVVQPPGRGGVAGAGTHLIAHSARGGPTAVRRISMSVAAIFGAHVLLHVNYQYSRTSLYLIPVFHTGDITDGAGDDH